MSNPVRLTPSEINALIEPPPRRAAAKWTRAAVDWIGMIGFVLLMFVFMDAALEDREQTGDSTPVILVSAGIGLVVLVVILGAVLDWLRRLHTVERGLQRRVLSRVEVIPWKDLEPAVITGLAWPYEITFRAVDGRPVGSVRTNEPYHRELVLEVLSRIPVRDERTRKQAPSA